MSKEVFPILEANVTAESFTVNQSCQCPKCGELIVAQGEIEFANQESQAYIINESSCQNCFVQVSLKSVVKWKVAQVTAE